MKKKISIALCILFAIICVAIPNFSAKAESLTVTGIPGQVKLGESFTISISVPKNIGGSVFVEYSNNILRVKSSPGSDVGTGSTSYTAFFNSSTEQVTFEAKATGTATISVYMVDAEYSDKDPSEALPNVQKYTKSFSVINEVATETPSNKSGDNSLYSLKLSSGTLSPSFKYNVTKYTATVDYNVSEVTVSAVKSHEKASIVSITGDGAPVKLKVGENEIKIVVQAENGVKATYTIVVTRKAQSASTEPQPPETETTTPDDEVNEVLQYNGEQLAVPEEIPAASIPSDFESSLLVVNGQQMQGLSFAKAELKVLYLNNTNGAGSLYVYDEEQEMIYPFIKLESEKSYVMVLVPNEQKEPAPEGFKSCTLSIEGKGVINAYQLKSTEKTASTLNIFGAETFYADEVNASDFYLIYCMNDNGEKGWYLYDSVEETFQRYLASALSVPVGGNGTDDSQTSDVTALEKELKQAKMVQYIIIAIAAAVVVILLIVIIVLIIKNRKSEDDFFDSFDDDDDDVFVDTIAVKEEMEEVVVPEVVEEEDEIEIEFYEMEAETVEEDEEDDDEIEIEFFNMEELIVSETEESEEKIERKPKVVDPTSKLSSKKDDGDDDLEFIDFE